jgi:hypothetical protein
MGCHKGPPVRATGDTVLSLAAHGDRTKEKKLQIQVRSFRRKRALEMPHPVQFKSLGGFELEIGMGHVCGG